MEINRETINLLPLGHWQGPVHLIRSPEQIESMESPLARADLLGFDTETRPAFKRGQQFPPSLLQLATGEEVFLLQLRYTGLPRSIRTVLEDSAIIKVGVAPDHDLRALRAMEPFQPGGFIDLARLARDSGIRQRGLRGLAAAVCAVRISKTARTSNWSSDVLTPRQIRYAATDAWIGREIFLRLRSQRTCPPDDPSAGTPAS
ncbi:3'-5' exonuclease [Desulfobulbus alkaliphilus]|uniref:3'-5' exonuclease n=1 Tax=Desulfobulbus alkaliphilus TaxID=869814 RepID=UPI001963A61F|nr:3'-5' exonuclease [Desulfobulbus alkaliphilus]MBM9538086.1 3'-5' exonuclease domain-containing protein 2 [Desulfobulbus alkaliphilus]